MRNGLRASAAFTVLWIVLGGCAIDASGASSAPPTVLAAAGTPGENPAAPGAARQTGPKKRIAVAKFDAVGTFVAQYGAWDVGGGLAAQLTTALLDSGQFIVVERAELASLLKEQELATQKTVSKETATQVGRLLGIQLMVAGAVTEFEQRASGGGLKLGLAGGIFGGALGGESVNGVVGMDIRLVDTTTGQVVQSHRVEAKVSQTKMSADINVQQVTFGGDAFNNTVLGQATRQAIAQGVAFIVRSMERVPWTARIVDVAGDQVYVNAGSSAGLKAGDVFSVATVVRELTDPDSGALLGIVEEQRGEIELVNVQEKFSVAVMKTAFPATRGDLVKPSRR